MPLTNFGAILSFAEEIEKQDEAFYMALMESPQCSGHKELFGQFVKDSGKNRKNIERTRRENVTEMILENIEGFDREPFLLDGGDAYVLDAGSAVEAARKLEARAERYYLEASAKLKALPEVSRTLKSIAKKHGARIRKLAEI
jgi:rubrerythrin